MTHFKEPSAVAPNTAMTPVALSDPALKDLLALMLKLTPATGDVVDTAPEFAVGGAYIFQKNNCGACHAVNGVGGKDRSAVERCLRPAHAGLGNRTFRESAEDVSEDAHASLPFRSGGHAERGFVPVYAAG